MKIQCRACNYSMRKDVVPKRCPYCGKEGTMSKAKDAQDLIDDALQGAR